MTTKLIRYLNEEAYHERNRGKHKLKLIKNRVKAGNIKAKDTSSYTVNYESPACFS